MCVLTPFVHLSGLSFAVDTQYGVASSQLQLAVSFFVNDKRMVRRKKRTYEPRVIDLFRGGDRQPGSDPKHPSRWLPGRRKVWGRARRGLEDIIEQKHCNGLRRKTSCTCDASSLEQATLNNSKNHE